MNGSPPASNFCRKRKSSAGGATRSPPSAASSKIEEFKKRMRWSFRWLSSSETDFNYDFNVSFKPEDVARGAVDYNYSKQPFPELEAPGVSVFLREGDDVLHTYSTYARGLDVLISTYNYLDLTPLGRNEKDLSYTMSWLRHHDRYRDPA